MLTISIDRHAGAGWEDWSAYIFPVTDVSTESQARAGSGPASVRFVDPPAIPQKNWGLRVEEDGDVSFEGLVDGVKHSDEDQPGSPVVHVITAGDYSDLLEFDVVPRVWRSAVETDKERITWLIETYGTHGVTCGDEVQEVIGTMPAGADGRPEQEFGPSTLAEAIGKVLKLTGGQVYVDYQKRAHHFIDEVIAAPFNLSDDPNGTTTREYFDFELDEDNVTKVDEVVVFGAQQAEGAGLLTVTRTAPDAPAAEYRRRVPLVDDKLDSVALCEAAGDAFLQFHRGRRSGTLKTIYPGLLGGQTVQITHATQGLTAEAFRIHSVKPTIDGPDGAVYTVAFGDAPPSQVDIIAGTGGLASKVAAGVATAIDASRTVMDLSVGGANLVANSNFASAQGATFEVGAEWVFGYAPVSPEVAMSGSKTARASLTAQAAGELVTGPVPVYRLDDWWMTVWTFLRAYTSGTVRIELREYDSSDDLLASTVIADLTAAEADYTAHRLHMGPNDELGRTGFDAATVAVRLAIFTTGASTLTLDVGGVQIERGKLATAYAPVPSELADGSIDAGVKLVARSIVAAMVATGTLTADLLAATLVLVSKIIAGTPGADRIELDPDGLRLYSAANILLVNFPTLSANAYFTGDIQATSLTLTGAGEIRGTMSLAKDTVLTAQAGLQPPNATPQLTQGLPAPLTLEATAGWTNQRGGYCDPVGGTDGATPCWVAVQKDGSSNFRVAEWKLSDGSLDRTTALALNSTTQFRGLTRVGSNWYMVWYVFSTLYVLSVARATGAIGVNFDITGYFYGPSIMYTDPIGTDGTYLYVIGWATDANTLRVVKLSTAIAYVSTQALTLPGGTGHPYPKDFTVADIGDGHGVCFWVNLMFGAYPAWTPGVIYQFTPAGAVVADTDWPENASSSSVGGGGGLSWDGTNWRQLPLDSFTLDSFTNWTWTTASPVYWVASAWYDDAGTTHETPVSPRASITMLRRRALAVVTSAIPVGGAEDPNKVRIYMVPGAADPGPTHYKLQAADALTSRVLTTYASGGAADGGGTDFAGGTGAEMKSALPGWNFRGTGRFWLKGQTSFPGAASAHTGEHVLRSDLGEWYFSDGTQWLSCHHYEWSGFVKGSVSGMEWDFSQFSSMYITDFRWSYLVASNHTASNYWQAALQRWNGASNVVVITLTSDKSTAGAWVAPAPDGIASPVTRSDEKVVYVSVGKTGTPGTIDVAWAVRYRLIAT